MEDRSWMYDMLDEHRRLRPEYLAGVHSFVNKAMQNPQYLSDRGIRCPCSRCDCEHILNEVP